MALKKANILELIFTYSAVAFFIILGFKGPQMIESYDAHYDTVLKEAESINFLFRTIVFFFIAIVLIWRIARPNKVLRIISISIITITVVVIFLDYTDIVNYYKLFSIKRV